MPQFLHLWIGALDSANLFPFILRQGLKYPRPASHTLDIHPPASTSHVNGEVPALEWQAFTTAHAYMVVEMDDSGLLAH